MLALSMAIVIVAAPLLGMLWAPAMVLITEGAEARGIDPAFGFGLANLAWGAGAAAGGGAGGALAQAAGDAVPYLLLAAIAVATAFVLKPTRRQFREAAALSQP